MSFDEQPDGCEGCMALTGALAAAQARIKMLVEMCEAMRKAMIQESFMRSRLPEKDERIQKAITEALIAQDATNVDALNAAMILLAKCLRCYPLGMREAHADHAFQAVMDSAFAECLEADGPEARA